MADDVFQESFLRFLRAKPVVLNENHQKAYLYKVASRLIIDKKRRIKIERKVQAEKEKSYKEEIYKEDREHDTLLSLDMENTFKSLKPKERILLWLSYVDGYTSGEIAEITNSKENSIKVQLLRARRKLASLLRQKKYEEGN